MAAKIVSIFDVMVKGLVTVENGEEKVLFTFVVPQGPAALVTAAATREQLRSGQSPFVGQLSGDVAAEFFRRIGLIKPTPAKAKINKKSKKIEAGGQEPVERR